VATSWAVFKRSNWGLSIALGIGLAVSSADAGAQQSSPSGGADVLDEVVVTGSRIRRDTPVGNIAVTEIDSGQIEVRGFVNPIESLEQLPFVEVGVNNRGTSTQFGDNNAYINLYGLGQQRTLTLIDGRRMVSSVQGSVFNTGNITGSQVDVSIINPSIIKASQVRTVGAGAVYGADAVAGVVNFILDREFKGLKATTQYGISDRSDGVSKRVSIAWGDELLDGRANLVLAGEYFEQDAVYLGPNRPWSLVGSVTNPLSASTSDGVRDSVFVLNPISLQTPLGGRLDMRRTNVASTAFQFFPAFCTAAAGKTGAGTHGGLASCSAFTTARGAAPYQFAIANPTLAGLNPLAFVGTFGLTSAFPVIPTAAGSPEALAGLNRIALPRVFDGAGNPVALNLGSFLPPNWAAVSSAIDSGGFDTNHLNTLIAGQERYNFNAFFKFELTPAISYKGDVLYSRIDNLQAADNFQSNSPAASFTAGNAGIPIYYDQNPFVTAGTRAFINSVVAANPTNPFELLNGQRVFYLQRSLADITGSLNGQITNFEGNLSETFATGHTLGGDLDLADRDFYWEATFGYSTNKSENAAPNDILDIEFALATDVVASPTTGQPVCRQQLLAAPEAINIRNPYLTNINIATGIVPTKAQIDACKPLNLMGSGLASKEAIDYVITKNTSVNEAAQRYLSLQFGGEILELPAGKVLFNTEVQRRREELTFSPGRSFLLGLGRTTIGQPSDGYSETTEGGLEFSVPVFGGETSFPMLRQLQFDAAVRRVERGGEGTPNGILNPRVKSVEEGATINNIGGLWAPVEWLAFRGNKSSSVRSPSLVENLGAPQTGFSGLAGLFPCNAFNRNSGPASGIRITNCNALEARLGLPAGTFATLQTPGGTVPAGVAGSPSVLNETSDAWTLGLVMKFPAIEGLQIEMDYVDIRIDKQIALTWLGGSCFDQPDFPVSLIGGNSACESLTLAVGTGPGGLTGPFTIPATNIITGSPIAPPAILGAPASVQAPYSIATAKFSNVNAGSTWLQGFNGKIGWQFGVGDALESLGFEGRPWGEMRLDAYIYYLDRVRTSSSGTFGVDTVDLRGRAGWEKIQSRLDVAHRVGRFSHVAQLFYTGRSNANPFLNSALLPDQAESFFRPRFKYFNYNVGYEISDTITARAVVNNVFDDQLQPQFGLPGDSFGRNYFVRVDARF